MKRKLLLTCLTLLIVACLILSLVSILAGVSLLRTSLSAEASWPDDLAVYPALDFLPPVIILRGRGF
jgi:hypothetical protein